ncbi:MAG: TIGR00725 family protein [candidate division KSB1 bacterium]|nr:TIGR00725 family protein [candidate division KSB1 bacterium]MDZ7275489.1 TIGR00725 family protein [candidate division KSB1 bacterium]MDZ7286199.1 TIGR00725 family protein [candidate division KSB1 bacterium]MDZ7296425.1 TIGR00725 family protein [candidate division KSB1 bacterium]MDZ7309270.1 TIGR00725 family protein [candidate division KSB1 bacterium]
MPISNINKLIGVIGGSWCSAEIAGLARQVGEGIARGGAALICGGRGGVMAAACEGAKAAGGLTIGILPGESKAEANAFVDLKIVTGLLEARNVIIARSADALIAINGGHGTLSEIAFGLKFGKTVIGLHLEFVVPGVRTAATPAEAVQLAFQAIG